MRNSLISIPAFEGVFSPTPVSIVYKLISRFINGSLFSLDMDSKRDARIKSLSQSQFIRGFFSYSLLLGKWLMILNIMETPNLLFIFAGHFINGLLSCKKEFVLSTIDDVIVTRIGYEVSWCSRSSCVVK